MERPREMELLQYSRDLSRNNSGKADHDPVDRRDEIKEVDFFSEGHWRDQATGPGDTGPHHRQKEDVLVRVDSGVNIGLHLMTGNSGGGQPAVEEKRPNYKLIVLKAEVERLSDENRRLRSTLDQVTKNYSVLHNQLLQVMHQQAHEIQQGQKDKNNMLSPVPSSAQQFMEPGPTSSSTQQHGEHARLVGKDKPSLTLSNKVDLSSKERDIVPFAKRQLALEDEPVGNLQTKNV